MWNLFRRHNSVSKESLPRIKFAERPLTYAIGDVHGCLDDLKRLEKRIVDNAASFAAEKLIVMLGDYLDRGPKSAETIDWLLRAPPAGFQRLCLRGNHEALFLQALDAPERCGDWLEWGGRETLYSYGMDAKAFEQANGKLRRQMLQALIPEDHRRFLSALPVLLEIPGVVFVHAGLRPRMPLDRQSDQDLLWIREPFLSEPHGLDALVVHGHTPASQPAILPHRIGIDTMAYGGGVLTALRLGPDGSQAFLTS